MLRGVALATSQLITQGQRLKDLAANLANVDTPGYLQDQTAEETFKRMLLDRLSQGSAGIGGLDLGPVLGKTQIDLSSGPIEQTNRNLDVAIEGTGFFAVQAPDGVRYTRRGSFQQDATGRLVSLEGWPVLGITGPITANGPTTISASGQVLVNGKTVGQLRIDTFPVGTQFDRREGTYLVARGATPVASSALVRPGYLEGSNVDLTTTMSAVLAATRSYQAAQRALVTQSDEVGRLIDDVNAP